MTLILNEEQELLRDSAKSFVDDQWQLNQLRANRAVAKVRHNRYRAMAANGRTRLGRDSFS